MTGSREVVAGFFSFTQLDAGQHAAYDVWHRLDHLPEQFTIAGIVAGERWECTPRCRDARAAIDPALDATDFLTLYLMTEPLHDTLAEFRELARRLRSQGRFFEHRRSLLSGPYAVTSRRAASAVPVSPEAIPWRPNSGIYVVVARGEGELAGSLIGDLVDRPGVAGVWSFASMPGKANRGVLPGEHAITVAYLDGDVDPVYAARGIERVLEPGVRDRILYAGPFEALAPLLPLAREGGPS